MNLEMRSLRKLAKKSQEYEDQHEAYEELLTKYEQLSEENKEKDERIVELEKRLALLEEENRFLKLPRAAKQRIKHQEMRERAQRVKELKSDLSKSEHFKPDHRVYKIPPKYFTEVTSTGSSTPGAEDTVFQGEYLKKFDFIDDDTMKSLPRNRLKFIPGQNVKVTKDIYRRSFGHINSIKETLVEENKENLDAVPEIETQSFRVFDINSDDCDENESEEDLSDGAFERMHQKHEQAEYKMVQKDKAAQQLQKRQRQEEKAKEKNRNPFPEHLYSGNEIKEIHVEKEKPVLTLFGAVVPAIEEQNMSLPWMVSQMEYKKAKTRQNAKRKSTSNGAL